MPKRGIKILDETIGTGRLLQKGDRVRVTFDCLLNRGKMVCKDRETVCVIGSRECVAGFRYGLEDMHVGGTRTFRASPHLCYSDKELEQIPKNAVLTFDIKSVELLA